MLACYAWSNLQLLNVTNARINLYADEQADLYIRMGEHISRGLVSALEKSGVYSHVYCIDPLVIDSRKTKLGRLPKLRVLSLKSAYSNAYAALLGRLCGEQEYTRAVLPWFFADSVFLLKYWASHTKHLPITFVEEGTSSYCYTKKQMCFSLFNAPTLRAKLKRALIEGALMRKFKKSVDTLCLYRPDYCQPDIDFKKLTLPVITEESNPIMYRILCGAVASLDYTHFIRYNKRNIFYFSTYSVGDPAFEAQSMSFLNTLISKSFVGNVICKVHTHSTTHAERFAQDVEDLIFVDREKYIFEGLFMQLQNRDNKVIVSCASTTAINPKFMFGDEPYVIFTYRLHDGYRQNTVERDDWLAEALRDSYEDKSKVMIPNSIHEFENMLKLCR